MKKVEKMFLKRWKKDEKSFMRDEKSWKKIEKRWKNVSRMAWKNTLMQSNKATIM